MSRRRSQGGETWHRLSEWDRGQAPAERLAGQILRAEGFEEIDPSHPLGGPDGLKDVVCIRNEIKWIGAAYFPRGQQSIAKIQKKFNADLKGVVANDAQGLAFVTNQELKLTERESLEENDEGHEVELFHLERIANLLDFPQYYGLRLEFLDIEMNKEELLAFIASRDEVMMEGFRNRLDFIVSQLHKLDLPDDLRDSVPLKEIEEFKRILDSIAGDEGMLGNIGDSSWTPLLFSGPRPRPGRVTDLRVPLADLEEFERILNRISSNFGYNASTLASSLLTYASPLANLEKVSSALYVPIESLREYEKTLDRVIQKLREKRDLEEGTDSV